jgi:hypothetical protein
VALVAHPQQQHVEGRHTHAVGRRGCQGVGVTGSCGVHVLAVPETWDCPRCGFPAGQDEANPPAPPKVEPYKTHLAYVKERRSDADGKAILDEALATLRERKLIQ